MGAEELVAVAMQRLRAGALPLQESEQVWGGRALGDNQCALCAASIPCDCMELETLCACGTTRFFHVACFDAVSTARPLAMRSDTAATTVLLVAAGMPAAYSGG